MTLYEQLGGARLRAMVTDFYAAVFVDPMIGFLFAGQDRARLIEREWELAARMLGGDVAYTGRTIREAHKHVPILGGHFDRRLELWRQAMVAHGFTDEVIEALMKHNRALRAQVTADPTSDCNHEQVQRVTAIAAPETLVTLKKR